MAIEDGTVEPARVNQLRSVLTASSWFMGVLAHVAAVDPPHWWVGAGVVRDLVWDERLGAGFEPAKVKDVDVAFFDADDLSRDRDLSLAGRLRQRDAAVSWDAKNQAAVHLWYAQRFGFDVAPFGSVTEAIATWPEYATCVAVKLNDNGTLEICAPHGLDDLLDGVWQRNPTRVTEAQYATRLARKDPATRWPDVRVI